MNIELEVMDKFEELEYIISNASSIPFSHKSGIDKDIDTQLFVIFNPNKTETTVKLPKGDWNVCIDGEKAGTKSLQKMKDTEVKVAPISAMVLCEQENIEDYKEELIQEDVDSLSDVTEKKEKNTSFFSVALGAGVALAVLTAIYHKKK